MAAESSPPTVAPAERGSSRLVNLRDVGGLPLVTGGATRSAVLYRSDAPFTGDATPDTVSVWPPATVIDLRSTKEREVVGYEWPSRTTVHHLPLHGAAAPTELPTDLGGLYSHILDSATERLVEVVGVACRASDPVLVHCSVGKDRTGVTIAALLLAAGVQPDAVVSDYLATTSNVDALVRRWTDAGLRLSRRGSRQQKWLTAPREAIASVVQRLCRWPEGPAGWLVDHGADAADLQAWRTRMAG